MKECGTLSCALRFFEEPLRSSLEACCKAAPETVCEIRVYTGKAIVFQTPVRFLFCLTGGRLSPTPCAGVLKPDAGAARAVIERASDYSLYLHAESLRRGFLTKNGCRIGICGAAGTGLPEVISSLNIRIPYQGRPRCEPSLLGLLGRGGLLVAGAPGTGKTTVLRSMAAALASGETGAYRRVSVIDTRGEFGKALADDSSVISADVLTGPDKDRGIETAIRLFSPEYVVCDEIGNEAQARGLLTAANAGVVFLASVHAADARELARKRAIVRLVGAGVFETVVFLSAYGRGRIERIITGEDARYEICGGAAGGRAAVFMGGGKSGKLQEERNASAVFRGAVPQSS